MLIVLAVLVLIQAGDEGNIDSWWAIPIGAAAVGIHKLGNVFPQPD